MHPAFIFLTLDWARKSKEHVAFLVNLVRRSCVKERERKRKTLEEERTPGVDLKGGVRCVASRWNSCESVAREERGERAGKEKP